MFSLSLFSICASLRSLVSRGNPTKIHRWWGRLSPETRAWVETMGFKRFIKLQPTKLAKKIILYVLAERWWDTTHTLHISGVEITITLYDIHRMTGLRWNGLPLLLMHSEHASELTESILSWIWERLQLISLVFFMFSKELLRSYKRRGPRWQGLFFCT
jgi:hypothetical protein